MRSVPAPFVPPPAPPAQTITVTPTQSGLIVRDQGAFCNATATYSGGTAPYFFAWAPAGGQITFTSPTSVNTGVNMVEGSTTQTFHIQLTVYDINGNYGVGTLAIGPITFPNPPI